MNDPTLNPSAVVRETESLDTIARQINAEHAAQENSARDSAKRARKIGDWLLEVKARCGHGQWLGWVKANVRFSHSLVARYMRVASNWSKLNPGSTLDEIYKFLSEEGKEAEPPKPPPPQQQQENPPLCQHCKRLARTSQAPRPGCADCKKLRAEWQAQQEREPGVEPEEEQADPTEGLKETSGPSKRKRRGKGGNPAVVKPPKPGAAAVTPHEFGVAVGRLEKMMADMASGAGLLGAARPGDVRPVIETPELCGFRRQLEEMKKGFLKYLKTVAKTKE